MLKKSVSVFLCFITAFFSVTAYLSESGGGTVSAARVYDMPYYYNQLSGEAQETYTLIRNSVLNFDKSVYINDFAFDDYEKIAELIVFHDPLTFNVKDIYVIPVLNAALLRFEYRYGKNEYDKMVSASDKEVNKILSKFTDDMSDYQKIQTIHDSIVNTASYDLENEPADTVYGTLVDKKAKCDGYAKTFSYICGQAGIRAITVIGDDLLNDTGDMHMWNKVYYNKKWYNVDVTWDDAISRLKNNLTYDFFMVSDSDIEKTHSENNFSFDVPAAYDSSKNYFSVYKKYAESYEDAQKIFKSELATAVRKGKTSVSFKCSTKKVYDQMKKLITNKSKLRSIMKSAAKKGDGKLITEIYSYGFNDYQYVVNFYVYYEDTNLEDYYNSTDGLSKESLALLAEYGIK